MVDAPSCERRPERIRVALPVPIDSLFQYRLPDDTAGSVAPGCRVLVPFSGRRLVGIVVDTATAAGSPRVGEPEPVERVLDSEPVLSPAMITILREAATEFACPVGIALCAGLPPGSAPRASVRFALSRRGRAALESRAARGATRSALLALRERDRSAASLRRVVRGAPALLRQLERDGLVVRRAVTEGPRARVATERVAALRDGVNREAALRALHRAPKQSALLKLLADSGPLEIRALAERFGDAAGLVRALQARKLVEVSERVAPRDVLGSPLEPARTLELTPEQAEVLKPITDAVRSRRSETFLLHGVTGSGKTEVYLRAIDEALRAGREALVLVPEITLTHQILARLRGRFGDGIAVLHSGLRPGERLEQWQRLKRGESRIAVGARSALFAPLENLGIVVVDEEHDAAYKNEEGFRYHARSLARRRAVHAHCPLVLGSATPSLETRFAADRSDVRRLTLPSRIGGRPLPAVEIVDLVRERERTPRGRRIVLSRPLRLAMSEALAERGQIILLLNRRGFSTRVLCFECGAAERCEHCDIALVYHATERELQCHYCDFRIAPRETCAACGAPDTALLGIGTERLEEEVRIEFPDARIARLDRDTAKQRGFTEGVLRDIRDGRVDVLIGTQLVSKGHDFPGVRLVGVVVADIGLHFPDFRAAERTFQLLTQVAGRAGRDAAPGRVVIQTFTPDHYAIGLVRGHDYESFYAQELEHRAQLHYPPFGRLVHVVVSAVDAQAAHAGAAALAAAARSARASGALGGAKSLAAADLEILGPAAAPLSRLRGRHRFQILLKGTDERGVLRAARSVARACAKLPRGVQATVDADPVNMM